MLVGLWERPTTLSSEPRETVTIGVEFHAHGLARFVPGVVPELTERIVPVQDVLGHLGRALNAEVMDQPTPEAAAGVVERFLIAQLRRSQGASVTLVDAAMKLLVESRFTMQVNELERRMGYSRRFLHARFVEHVGLSPKRLSGVMLFERLYRRFSQDKSPRTLRDDALGVYFDQSHFIRTFKRYTGFSPRAFAELDNEFGRIFYREGSSQMSNTRGA